MGIGKARKGKRGTQRSGKPVKVSVGYGSEHRSKILKEPFGKRANKLLITINNAKLTPAMRKLAKTVLAELISKHTAELDKNEKRQLGFTNARGTVRTWDKIVMNSIEMERIKVKMVEARLKGMAASNPKIETLIEKISKLAAEAKKLKSQ